jgi:hypothetical protein
MPDKKVLAGIIMSRELWLSRPFPYSEDMLDDIVQAQTSFAKRFHVIFVNKDQKELLDTGSSKVKAFSDMIQGNLAAITNEVEEIREWLPWKHWRRYQGFDIDLEEIRLEYIDILHFVLEGLILTGMDAEDIHRYYTSKMEENLKRQREGY